MEMGKAIRKMIFRIICRFSFLVSRRIRWRKN